MNATLFRQPLHLTCIAALLLTLEGPALAQAIKPQARWLHHMAYDDQKKEILMYGGYSKAVMGDLWALSATGWKKLSDEGPPPRIKAAFTYDQNRKVAVLFGGADSNDQLLGDTWEWNGSKWTERVVKGPGLRNHQMAAYDRKRKATILFGGFGPAGGLTDTWAFDGNSWKLLNNDGPKDCLPHCIFYDAERGTIVMLTLSGIREPGDDVHAKNELWELTGNSWKKFPDGTSIMTNGNLQTVSSFRQSEIILFDGDDGQDLKGKTWFFSKGTWTSAIMDGPSPRIAAAMVYDKSRGKTVLFGGGDRKNVFDDVWEWDGVTWKEVK